MNDNYSSKYGRRDEVPNWDEYFIGITHKIKERAKDPSTQNGCVIVDADNRPVSFGYTGFIAGSDDDKLTWERPMKYHFSIHAEMNALLFARRDLRDCKLYSIYFPCENCLKFILQSGIKEIIYEHAFVESKKRCDPNSMNTDETTEAVTRMLLAVKGVKTKNVKTGKNYLEEVWGGLDKIPDFK